MVTTTTHFDALIVVANMFIARQHFFVEGDMLSSRKPGTEQQKEHLLCLPSMRISPLRGWKKKKKKKKKTVTGAVPLSLLAGAAAEPPWHIGRGDR